MEKLTFAYNEKDIFITFSDTFLSVHDTTLNLFFRQRQENNTFTPFFTNISSFKAFDE